ncbi:MAG: hypothetical protein ACTFAL_16205 [Candidatus Electronema sp. V4]
MNLSLAVELSHSLGIYAYVLECSERLNAPLRGMKLAAKRLNLALIEV